MMNADNERCALATAYEVAKLLGRETTWSWMKATVAKWIADSGSGNQLGDHDELSMKQRQTMVMLDHPIMLSTANGIVKC